MPGTIKLVFTRPVDDRIPIIPGGGEYGASRPYGSHIGVDFSARRENVRTVEGGRVVYSDNRAGSENKANYGNVVVIDHTPIAGKDQRHIYSLYAHLDSVSISSGENVEKGSMVGISGNTGTRQYYEGARKGIPKSRQRGYHLHFEIIDSPKGFDFNGGWPGDLSPGDRKDPMKDYVGQKVIIEYELTEEEIGKIHDSLDIEPIIDFERGICRFDLYLDGKKVGFFDKQKNEVNASLTPEELNRILGNHA
ncbi:MAG: M23 family metallopeptidase [Deltaproteobacteria bacterium]|nr:M23 family metallopeptidase [Deltaproteobacteria bacterium]